MEGHAEGGGGVAAACIGGDDRHPLGGDVDVTAQQRQDGLADAAATDHHEAAAEASMANERAHSNVTPVAAQRRDT